MGLNNNGNGQQDSSPRQWWLGVEVRHFAALAAIAEEGSFRGAAESLGYVQSAVSQQLAQLEALVGEQLVVRRRGSAPVALTDAGELLLVHANVILSRFGAAHADLESRRRPEVDSLHIGVLESVETYLMPRVLTHLLQRAPGLRVLTTPARDSAELLGRLEDGELDAAFCPGTHAQTSLMSRRLLWDPYLLVVPAGSDLAAAPHTPDPDVLAGLDLIGHDLMPDVESQLRQAGVTVNTVVTAHSNAAVQAMVAASIGAAILPALAVNESDPRVACVPLDGLLAPGAVSLVWQRGRRVPGPLRHFVDLADRTGQALERELARRPNGSVDPVQELTHLRPVQPVGVAVGEGA